MSEATFMVAGRLLVRPEAVAAAKWSKDKLYVFLLGGNYVDLAGVEADRLWQALTATATDLDDGATGWKKVNDAR